MTYDDALSVLFAFRRVRPDARPGVEIARRFIDDNDLARVTQGPLVFQITGTNGKGSTADALRVLMSNAGLSTLMVTSPHLGTVRERIRINGEPIGKGAFVASLESVLPWARTVAETAYHPNPIQILTLMALSWHAREGVGFVGIYEVGSGGASDSTNVFVGSIVGTTAIGGDHLPQFGGTLSSLAEEKIGLASRAAKLVFVAQPPAVARVMRAAQRRHGMKCVPVSPCMYARAKQWVGSDRLARTYVPSLALACMMASAAGIEIASPSAPHMRLGGRADIRQAAGRTLVLDVAHNLPAISLILRREAQVAGAGCRPVALIALSRSRDWEHLLMRIARSGVFGRIIVTRSSRPRCVDPEVVVDAARARGLCIEKGATVSEALRAALSGDESRIAVFGSSWLVADVDWALATIEGTSSRFEHDPPQPWMLPR